MAGVAVIWLVIIGTSIWVAVDSSNIGARKGLVKGSGNMGPAGWLVRLLPADLDHWLSRLPRQAVRDQGCCGRIERLSTDTGQRGSGGSELGGVAARLVSPGCPKPATRRGRHSIGSHQQSRRACQVRCTAPVRGSDPGGVQRREGEAAQSTAAAANPSSVRL